MKKEVKNIHVTFRVTKKQSDEINKLATKLGLNKSKAILKTLLND
jgi:hypothetical protein